MEVQVHHRDGGCSQQRDSHRIANIDAHGYPARSDDRSESVRPSRSANTLSVLSGTTARLLANESELAGSALAGARMGCGTEGTVAIKLVTFASGLLIEGAVGFSDAVSAATTGAAIALVDEPGPRRVMPAAGSLKYAKPSDLCCVQGLIFVFWSTIDRAKSRSAGSVVNR